jgi:FMN reductase
MALKLLGVAGSLRDGSHSTLALRLVLDLAQKRGAETRLLDLRTMELPLYRPDAADSPAIVTAVGELVRWADAFVLSSPDYHGSMSGAMKNFLDYHWREFAGKLFGYLCASHEKGLTAMEQMRTAVRQCYGWSLPYGAAVHGDQDLDETGEISARLRQRLEMLARDMVVYGTLLREQFRKDIASGLAEGFAARYEE